MQRYQYPGAVPTSATHPRILANEDFKTLIKFVRKVKEQLKEYEKDPSSCKVMNAERRQQLVDIGFLDDSDDGKTLALRDKNWEEKFELLKEYKLKFGSCKSLWFNSINARSNSAMPFHVVQENVI